MTHMTEREIGSISGRVGMYAYTQGNPPSLLITKDFGGCGGGGVITSLPYSPFFC